MGVNSITASAKGIDNKSTEKTKVNENKQDITQKNQTDNDTAAVYEKSEQSSSNAKIYKRDDATVDRLLQEADKRAQSLRDLVEKMLFKQGQTFDDSTDIYKLLQEGKVDVDPETSAQAQKDIAEDGYWGVKETSDRLVSFAKALSGGDPSKANLMIDSVKKGFEQATKAWGDGLPSICKDTLDATISKLEDWRDSISKENEDNTNDN